MAIEFRHERIWRFILSKDAKVDSRQLRPLKIAIGANDLPALDALIAAGFDVNDVDLNPPPAWLSHRTASLEVDTALKSALVWSNDKNRKTILLKLLDRGASVALRTRHGSALEFAMETSTKEIVRMLLDATTELCDPTNLLFFAAGNMKENLIALSVELGADVNIRVEGGTVLTEALRNYGTLIMPTMSAVQPLLDLGLHIDLSYEEDREAVTSACEPMVLLSKLKKFIPAGIDLNTNYGKEIILLSFLHFSNPRFSASKSRVLPLRSKPLLHWAIDKGADINQTFPTSVLPTLLSIAAVRCTINEVQCLLDCGADPALSTDFGFGSALVAAAFHGSWQECRLLLNQQGVDVNQHHHGFFPNVLYATITGHLDYLRMFKRRGNSKIWDLTSRLGYNINNPRHLKVMKDLIQKGLHLNLPIYNSIEAPTPFFSIGTIWYVIGECCLMHNEVYQSSLPSSWFFIIWELHFTAGFKYHLQSLLRRWFFPGVLGPSSKVLAKVKGCFKFGPEYVVIISLQKNDSQLNVLPIPPKRRVVNFEFKDRRWKAYTPLEFGGVDITRDPVPSSADSTLNPKNISSLDRPNRYSASQDESFVFWLLSLVVISVLAYFLSLAKELN
ncbi:hypothetical protein FSHL1_002607 [Fusarium sambucinum]